MYRIMNGKMVGDVLREARLAKQLQLTDIESMTGIAVQHLLALELDQFALVPAEMLEEYLTKFAETVGLNSKDIYTQYEKQVSFQNTLSSYKLNESEKASLSVIEPSQKISTERRSHRRRRDHREETKKKSKIPAFLFGLVVLAAIAVAGYFIIQNWPMTPETEKVTRENSETTIETTSTESTTVTEAITPVKVTAQADGTYIATIKSNKEKVDITFTQTESESWVSVNDGVNGDQGTTLTANQKEFTVSVNKGTSSFITVGIPSAATVTVDGATIDLTEIINFSPASFTLVLE